MAEKVDMNNQNKITRGNIAEMVVMLEATKRGIVVSKPFTHDARYDLIFDVNGKLFKIQIKRAFLTKERNGKESLIVDRRRFVKINKTRDYENGDFDHLVCVDMDKHQFWFFGFNELEEMPNQIRLWNIEYIKNIGVWF
jgi:hypothetical protein